MSDRSMNIKYVCRNSERVTLNAKKRVSDKIMKTLLRTYRQKKWATAAEVYSKIDPQNN